MSLEWKRMKETRMKKIEEAGPREAESASVSHFTCTFCFVPSRCTSVTQSFSGPLSWEPSTLHRCCIWAEGKQHFEWGWTLPRDEGDDQAACSPSFAWVRTRTRTLLHLNPVHLAQFSHPFPAATNALVHSNSRQLFFRVQSCVQSRL